MITKRLKGYVLYLYTQKRTKIQLLIILTTKQGKKITSKYQKKLSTLNMFPKNKQNNLRLTKKNEIKDKSYLYYINAIKYAFCFLIFFR